jgi:hypothetical protein
MVSIHRGDTLVFTLFKGELGLPVITSLNTNILTRKTMQSGIWVEENTNMSAAGIQTQ